MTNETKPNTLTANASTPQNAPSKPAETAAPQGGTNTAPTAKPISAPPTVTAAAPQGNATVQGDRGAPNTTASPGTKANPLPMVDPKPQGGKATTNPQTNPMPKSGQGGTVGGKATGKSVTAAKPEKAKSQRDANASNPNFVLGHDLSRWPSKIEGFDNAMQFKPTEVDIAIARVLNGGAGAQKINELNLACELGAHVFSVKRTNGTVYVSANVNVYNIGDMVGRSRGQLKGDHKMNALSAVVRAGLCCFVKSDGSTLTGPNVKASDAGLKFNNRVCYGVRLTKLGIAAAEKAGLKVPTYMYPPLHDIHKRG